VAGAEAAAEGGGGDEASGMVMVGIVTAGRCSWGRTPRRMSSCGIGFCCWRWPDCAGWRSYAWSSGKR
jgi:hypothetical protein